jgi:hypothetical protein
VEVVVIIGMAVETNKILVLSTSIYEKEVSMKSLQHLLGLTMAIVLCSSLLQAQPHYIILSGGFQETNMLGAGIADNKFDFGPGLNLEFGVYLSELHWTWIMYGYRSGKNTNHVKASEAQVTFSSPYYTELLFDIPSISQENKMRFYWSLGFEYNEMQFGNTAGPDQQYYYTAGFGTYIYLNNMFIQPRIKPYLVTSNSLGQNWGISLSVNVGWFLGTAK